MINEPYGSGCLESPKNVKVKISKEIFHANSSNEIFGVTQSELVSYSLKRFKEFDMKISLDARSNLKSFSNFFFQLKILNCT